jgi:glycosyltransferase involved in cell wall biosynthesis
MSKLSIITVNLNNKAGLKNTILSVINQTFRNFEFIVIDGDSKDGSTEIIKEYASNITYWVSEPDKGIYNAMNKGIMKASGEYCLFLNSGDWLIDSDVLEKASSFFKSSYDILIGNLFFCDHKKKELKTWKDDITPDLSYFIHSTLPHPSTFIKTSLFKEIGMYNEDYKIASDYDFFFKALVIHKKKYVRLTIDISVFNLDGISSQSKMHNTGTIEREKTLKHYFPDPVFHALIDCQNKIESITKELYQNRSILKKISDKYYFIKNNMNAKSYYIRYFKNSIIK